MQGLERSPAFLVLEDGSVFKGKAIGHIGTTGGEICFNTGMTGYQEIFSDPSYSGQIMVTTNAHIGNYGTLAADNESASIKIAGLVCKNFNNTDFSRPLAGIESIQTYLANENVVGISDVDTREIVRLLRTKGAMNAIISSECLDVELLKEKVKELPNMAGLELASSVSTVKPYYVGSEEADYRVAVLDFGVKRSILTCLEKQGIYLRVFPANTTFEQIMAWDPDGVFLSNGPGDPSPMAYAIETTKKLLEIDMPIFGICLGHQILSLACGLETYKMHHGHRGINHPVLNLLTNKSEISSQNHGFAVSLESINKHTDIVELTHVNLNDDSVEGLRLKHKPAFSVQYHPEAGPGPHDSRYLFEEFKKLIRNAKQVV
jgi:carbamoyl-phosphate synthase small subunit